MIAYIFDTETTGLIDNGTLPLDKQPEIIEFYGCSVNLETGEQLFETDLLIKPSKEFDENTKASRAHHIKNDELKDALHFRDLAETIKHSIITGGRPIAHNASFDKEIVEIEFARCGIPFVWPRTPLCTVEQTIHLKGYRMKLMELHEYLIGRKFEEAHRAKNDVQALVRCCVELFKRGEL